MNNEPKATLSVMPPMGSFTEKWTAGSRAAPGSARWAAVFLDNAPEFDSAGLPECCMTGALQSGHDGFSRIHFLYNADDML